jgi:hypothetical protein
MWSEKGIVVTDRWGRNNTEDYRGPGGLLIMNSEVTWDEWRENMRSRDWVLIRVTQQQGCKCSLSRGSLTWPAGCETTGEKWESEHGVLVARRQGSCVGKGTAPESTSWQDFCEQETLRQQLQEEAFLNPLIFPKAKSPKRIQLAFINPYSQGFDSYHQGGKVSPSQHVGMKSPQ